jgi:hypothetical protein
MITSVNAAALADQSTPGEQSRLNDPPMTKVPYFSTTQTSQDTAALQAKVLTKINQALSRGSITPEQATNFKERLNAISDQETWYKSRPEAIPPEILSRDTELLQKLNTDVEGQLPLKPTTQADDAMHREIHRLITTALAKNRITNDQAEKYYARLAQIEEDLESLKNDPAGSTAEAVELNEKLARLSAELKTRIKTPEQSTR